MNAATAETAAVTVSETAAVGNEEIAETLERVADVLEAQDANPHRVRAYRYAATSVREHAEPLARLLAREGLEGLDRLPGIGPALASAIAERITTGRLRMLERLEGELAPADLLTSVPGIGPELARRLVAELGVDSLEELELAAHDGRLAAVTGFGERRTRLVRAALAGMLGPAARRRARLRATGVPAPAAPAPRVATLLDVDAEYRLRAAERTLRTIAPRRFNPSGESWLPILHTQRNGFTFTALFSNTARAHELGATRDWVVVYYEKDGREGQCTVVTARRGALAGQRVVRGREEECRTALPA